MERIGRSRREQDEGVDGGEDEPILLLDIAPAHDTQSPAQAKRIRCGVGVSLSTVKKAVQ